MEGTWQSESPHYFLHSGEFCDSNGRPIRTEGKMNTEKLRDPE